MKAHKFITSFLLIASLGMSGLVVTPVQAANWHPVQATNWHKGTPKKLRGFWSTSNKVNYIWMTRSDMHFVNNGYGDGGNVGASYKYLGHHNYQIRQFPAMDKSAGAYTIKFRYKSGHIYVHGLKYHRTAKYF